MRQKDQTLCNGFATEMYQACTKGEVGKVDRIINPGATKGTC